MGIGRCPTLLRLPPKVRPLTGGNHGKYHFKDKTLLITGGTGSFGHTVLKHF